jgi:hypothetical protein
LLFVSDCCKRLRIASPSCKVFVAGVDGKKLMAYLEEFDINADALLSNSENEGFTSDSSEGIVLDTSPKFLKRGRLNVRFEKIPL